MRRINWWPLLVGAISLSITLLLWQAMLLQRDASIARFTQLAAKSVKSEIANRVQFQVNSLIRMAKRWESRKHMPRSEWENDAMAHVLGYTGYRAIEWIDPSLHVRWVEPANGNEKVKNIHSSLDLKRKAAIDRALATQSVVVSDVVDLVQGGKGFLIYVPIYIEQQFNGFILGVVDLPKFMEDVLSEHIVPGYNLRVMEGEQVIYSRGNSQQLDSKWGAEEAINLYGSQWKIRIWPEQVFLTESKSVLPNLILVVGLVITALLMFTTQFSQMATQQAKQIAQVNHNLQKEITEREEAEQAKDKMKKALLQSQKMQAIGTLAGGIAHDFNNILYSMIGYVEMARDDVESGTLIYENLSKVLSVGHRGQELVSRLLSFSRQQQHDFKPISLREVVAGTLVLLKPTIPASVEIAQQIDLSDEDTVLGGHTELQQVLVNIMSNAVDAITDQGRIYLHIYEMKADDTFRERFPKLRKPNYFVLEITDNGEGMPLHILQRVFEPFFTTKEVGKGTGLGLATALGVVHDHSGEMYIESNVGEGTKVIIYLPKYETREEE